MRKNPKGKRIERTEVEVVVIRTQSQSENSKFPRRWFKTHNHQMKNRKNLKLEFASRSFGRFLGNDITGVLMVADRIVDRSEKNATIGDYQRILRKSPISQGSASWKLSRGG